MAQGGLTTLFYGLQFVAVVGIWVFLIVRKAIKEDEKKRKTKGKVWVAGRLVTVGTEFNKVTAGRHIETTRDKFIKVPNLETPFTLEEILTWNWSQLEEEVGKAYRTLGYHVEQRGGKDPDGGVDLIAWKDGYKKVVQCKQWKKFQVGVKVIREMHSVMIHEKADTCTIITSSVFTQQAYAYAEGKGMRLINGNGLVELMEEARKAKLGITTQANHLPA